jgi:hypothetical protein
VDLVPDPLLLRKSGKKRTNEETQRLERQKGKIKNKIGNKLR